VRVIFEDLGHDLAGLGQLQHIESTLLK
jgi:hypothetical protein